MPHGLLGCSDMGFCAQVLSPRSRSGIFEISRACGENHRNQRSRGVANRVQKILEASGIKLSSVVSGVFGVTGRAILTELAANRTDPAALAEMAKGRLKKKDQLLLALEGSFCEHDAALLKHQSDLYAQLEQRRAKIQKRLVTMSESDL
jgi:hypothetical protein